MKVQIILFLFFIIGLSSCTFDSQRPESKILIYDNGVLNLDQKKVKEETDGSISFISALNSNYFHDDSLRQFSSVVIPFSSINKLNYRAIVALKRYLEAGGGGVVAIKDTLLAQQGWPWLQKWNVLETNKEQKQDKGNIKILERHHSVKDFQQSLDYAIGDNVLPDYNKAQTIGVPEQNRYTYQVLIQGLDEPMQMAILPGNDVLIVERKGAVKLFEDSIKQIRTIANFDVFSGIEDGLLGVALDPDFEENNWVYFYYAVGGEKAINRLSRMQLKEGNLIMASEKVLLEIPTQRQYCCHSAGYIQFGPDGLLYLSTGDNTNAEETEGYIPIDERPGRELADDQATAANTNDLRGKILRIKPEPDGSYSIPDGNLFPKGMPKTRPEIYIMGNRNPYRFSVDANNGFIYWGDVGPDTKVQSSGGTLSYDEINQARKPGFFGWPYFLGSNEAFPKYDFATKEEGPKFNPLRPINASPNNTGIQQLPPAQPAMIWYGDGNSKEFPLVGKGGESAMAGPVYYTDMFPDAPYKLSHYYDGKLFIYDWVRRWFMAVTFDEQMNYLRMEPFLDHIQFNAPTDMQFASDGSIYILEYGTNWFAKNSDAKLVRIEYTEGNRKPVVNIEANGLYGPVPYEVKLSAAGSKDFDKEDDLNYNWLIEGKEMKRENISYTFEKPGNYNVKLTVTDNHGDSNTSSVDIKVGNTKPNIDISTTDNQTFYWDNISWNYSVGVNDLEDKAIDSGRVNVKFHYLPRGKDVAVYLSNPQHSGNLQHVKGQYMLNNLDCKACHTVSEESAGPTYKQIARRYSGKAGATDMLAEKIIKGGSGNWGQRMMSSHPDLETEDAKEIVRYILSLNEADKSLPLAGSVKLNDHIGKGNEGSYLLVADYTDKGANGIEPLSAQKSIVLRNPLVEAEDYDDGGKVSLRTITTEFLTYANLKSGSFIRFDQIDLTHLKSIRYRIQKQGAGGKIEVRIGQKTGPLISTLSIPAGTDKKWAEVSASLKGAEGKHDLFFIFYNEKEQQKSLFNLDWLYFSN